LRQAAAKRNMTVEELLNENAAKIIHEKENEAAKEKAAEDAIKQAA
jgi:hypothetical protein